MIVAKLSRFLAALRVLLLPILSINAQDYNDNPAPSEDFGRTWNYSNPQAWPSVFPLCGGKKQSPVDINISETVRSCEPLSNLQFVGYDKAPLKMTMRNNGHAIEIDPQYQDGQHPYLVGGALKSPFMLTQIHFHWGPNNYVGGEHTLNGHDFPFEMHLVHRNRAYPDSKEAFKHEDGFVVVGRFFVLNDNGFYVGSAFGRHLTKLRAPNSKVSIAPFPLTDFGFYNNDDYVTYPGSLTSPSCNEFITWIVPLTPLHVAQETLDLFRQVRFTSGDTYNNRPTQPLNGRNLTYVPYNPNMSLL